MNAGQTYSFSLTVSLPEAPTQAAMDRVQLHIRIGHHGASPMLKFKLLRSDAAEEHKVVFTVHVETLSSLPACPPQWESGSRPIPVPVSLVLTDQTGSLCDVQQARPRLLVLVGCPIRWVPSTRKKKVAKAYHRPTIGLFRSK